MRRNEAEYLVSFLSMLITHAWVRPYRLHGKIATTAPSITPPRTKRFFFRPPGVTRERRRVAEVEKGEDGGVGLMVGVPLIMGWKGDEDRDRSRR